MTRRYGTVDWRRGEGCLSDVCKFSGASEHAGEHCAVQAAGVGVTQRGVVAAEQVEAVGQGVFGSVGEAVVRAAGNDAGVQQVGEEAVPCDFAEADDDTDARQRVDLCGEMDGTVADLLGRGLVAGRGAADDGADPGLAQVEAVVAGDGAGLRGEAKFMQDGVHEVAGAVASKGAAGAVGSVGTGSEAEDEDAGARVAKAGDRTRPVILILVGAAAGFPNAGAVFAEAGTEFAGDDRVADALVFRGQDWKLSERLGLEDPRRGRQAGRIPTNRFHRRGRADGADLTHTTAM